MGTNLLPGRIAPGGPIGAADHHMRRGLPPTLSLPTTSDWGTKWNLMKEKLIWAIFGTQGFGFRTPPPPRSTENLVPSHRRNSVSNDGCAHASLRLFGGQPTSVASCSRAVGGSSTLRCSPTVFSGGDPSRRLTARAAQDPHVDPADRRAGGRLRVGFADLRVPAGVSRCLSVFEGGGGGH